MTRITRLSLLLALLLTAAIPARAQQFIAAPHTAPAKTAAHADRHVYRFDTGAFEAYVSRQSNDYFDVEWVLADTLTWPMRLVRHDIRSDRYRLISSDGTILSTTDKAPVTYRGTLDGRPGSEVRMTVDGSFLRAMVRDEQHRTYYFETTGSDTPAELPTLSMYQAEEDEIIGACATNPLHEIGHVPLSKQPDLRVATESQSSMAPFETEIAFVVDRLGFEPFASIEDLELELLTILNYTDTYYSTHQITYLLTEIYVAVDLESQPWDENDDPSKMLEAFSAWAGSEGSLLHHDVATLWTGISFGSTIGIAWINVIGGKYRQNIVNFPNGRDRRNASVHAHELGHNWGSGHVGESGWIMSPALSGADQEQEWHDDTIAAFPEYIENALSHLNDLGTEAEALPVTLTELTIGDEMNDTGMLDPGETVELVLDIQNFGDVQLENVLVTMFNDNARAKNYVTINSDPVLVSEMDPGVPSQISFNITLDQNAPIDRPYRFLFLFEQESLVAQSAQTIRSGDTPIEELPVELIGFEALISGGDMVLSWSTASETNNAGFQVELQSEGGAFREAGFVDGAGTSLNERQYRYVIGNLKAGVYTVRLKQIDFDGAFEYSPSVTVALKPEAYSLEQNFPNPFNPQTRIEFQLPVQEHVLLEVFDALGRRIALLVDDPRQAGSHAVTFDASNLPNGTYVYRLQAGDYRETRAMVVMK